MDSLSSTSIRHAANASLRVGERAELFQVDNNILESPTGKSCVFTSRMRHQVMSKLQAPPPLVRRTLLSWASTNIE